MNWLISSLLPLIAPAVIGVLAMWFTQAGKTLYAKLDDAPAYVKQGFAAFWVFVLSWAGSALPTPLCVDGAAFCTLADLDWRALLSYALAVSLHGQKAKTR